MVGVRAVALLGAGAWGASPEEGAPIGVFEEWVYALEFQPAWAQGDCASNVTAHLNGSLAARELSIHGLWPNYNSSLHDDASWPQFCKNATLDFTVCNPSCSEALCQISAGTRAAMAARWAARYPEYAYGSLAEHEWSKHGSCTGLDQLSYFQLVDAKVAPTLDGAGASLVKSSVGADVAYGDLSQAFSTDHGGKEVALGCEGCNLSDVWFKFDSATSAPLDYAGTSTCAKCDQVHIIDFAKEGCK